MRETLTQVRAEGATAPETLRQKDRMCSLKRWKEAISLAEGAR